MSENKTKAASRKSTRSWAGSAAEAKPGAAPSISAANKKPAATAIAVATLHEPHPRIRAEDWRAPLVHRLLKQRTYRDGSARLDESFRSPKAETTPGTLELAWNGMKDDVAKCANTYQEPVLTEFATLGLACVLLTRHTKLTISEVTRRGERVDYWIGDAGNRKRFVLEVGGEQSGSIETLSNAKTNQLAENPWSRAGYICVAVYDSDCVRLWYCDTDGNAT